MEALGSTKVNLLLEVGFNREVGMDAALYWTKEPGNLSSLIERVSEFDEEQRNAFGSRAKRRILSDYSHTQITAAYEKIFLE